MSDYEYEPEPPTYPDEIDPYALEISYGHTTEAFFVLLSVETSDRLHLAPDEARFVAEALSGRRTDIEIVEEDSTALEPVEIVRELHEEFDAPGTVYLAIGAESITLTIEQAAFLAAELEVYADHTSERAVADATASADAPEPPTEQDIVDRYHDILGEFRPVPIQGYGGGEN